MGKLNVAVVGCGNISDIYFKNLTSTFKPLVDVVAACDLDTEKATAAASKYNVARVLTFDEAIGDPGIDIILNLTTPQGHYSLCKKALLAGKHVYVEKPLSLDINEGKELVKIARQNGLYLGSAPDTVLGAGIQTCVKLIDDGFIGEPVAATAFMVCHGHESWHPDPEFYYQKGGGPLLDMGPYYITALVSMLGPVHSVCAMSKITFPTRTITSAKKYGKVVDVETPTHVAATLRFKSGAIATLIMSFDIWQSSLPRIEVYGSRATLSVPDPNGFGGPVVLKGKEIPLTHPYDENSRGLGVADMARAISTQTAARAGGELSCHVLEIMTGLLESAEAGVTKELSTTCEKPQPMSMDRLG